MKTKKVIAITASIIVLLLIIFIPTKQVAYTIDVESFVSCPYRVPQSESSYAITKGATYQLDYTIRNLEPTPISFEFSAEFYDSDNQPMDVLYKTVSIPELSVKTFSFPTAIGLHRQISHSNVHGQALERNICDRGLNGTFDDYERSMKITKQETHYKSVNWIFG